jgi:DNA-binding MarR family transcriptional regulator
MQAYFATTPPSVHRMVVELETKGLISRQPGQARSIELLISPEGCRSCMTQPIISPVSGY